MSEEIQYKTAERLLQNLEEHLKTHKSEPKHHSIGTADLDFLKQDYWQKVQYLKDHFTRLWNRFNYFLTVQSALFGATVLSPERYRWWVPLFAALVCILWYIFGAQDRYLVELYRQQIEQSLEKIEDQLSLGDDYYMVGQTEDRKKATIERFGIKHEIYQWRWGFLSTTKLPALFPLFLLGIWVGILIVFLLRNRGNI